MTQSQPVRLQIRPFAENDWPQLWAVLEPAFRAGDSYPCQPDISEQDAQLYWLTPPKRSFLAVDDTGEVCGAYYIRPDQGGLGDHICNCGYVVHPSARGRGVAGQLAAHSEAEALRNGFLGMRFNLVVATNEAGVRAWRKAGFDIVGTVPKAFRHIDHGLVDAHVMFKWLAKDQT